MAIPFFAFQTLKKPKGGGGGTSNYNDLSNKPQINGHKLSGNKSSEDLGILTYKKLEVKGSPLGIYDGATKLTMPQVKALYADTKYYIYLEYLNIVFIPGARQSETSNAFEFFGGFQSEGKAYHCRVIINNENVVQYNQIELAESPYEYIAEENTTISGKVIPNLNSDELEEIYNEFVKGRVVYVLDKDSKNQYRVLSSHSDPLSIEMLCDNMGVIRVAETGTTITLFGSEIIETTETMNTSTLPAVSVPKLTKANLESISVSIANGKSVIVKNAIGEYAVTETDVANSEVRFTYFGYFLAYYLDGSNVIAEYSRVKTGTPEDDTDCVNKKYVDELVGDVESILNTLNG